MQHFHKFVNVCNDKLICDFVDSFFILLDLPNIFTVVGLAVITKKSG